MIEFPEIRTDSMLGAVRYFSILFPILMGVSWLLVRSSPRVRERASQETEAGLARRRVWRLWYKSLWGFTAVFAVLNAGFVKDRGLLISGIVECSGAMLWAGTFLLLMLTDWGTWMAHQAQGVTLLYGRGNRVALIIEAIAVLGILIGAIIGLSGVLARG